MGVARRKEEAEEEEEELALSGNGNGKNKEKVCRRTAVDACAPGAVGSGAD